MFCVVLNTQNFHLHSHHDHPTSKKVGPSSMSLFMKISGYPPFHNTTHPLPGNFTGPRGHISPVFSGSKEQKAGRYCSSIDSWRAHCSQLPGLIQNRRRLVTLRLKQHFNMVIHVPIKTACFRTIQFNHNSWYKLLNSKLESLVRSTCVKTSFKKKTPKQVLLRKNMHI